MTLILALPLLAALGAWSLRRWPRAVLLTGLATTLILWLLLFVMPVEVGRPPPVAAAAVTTTESAATQVAPFLFGRVAELTPGVRSLLLWLYPALALVFLLAWLQQEATAVIPSTLGAMSFLSGAFLVEPTSLGIILLIGVAVMLLPVMNGRTSTQHPNAAAAGLRYLLFTTLAVPPLLLVNWLVESGQGAQSSALFGFLLASLMLLGGFPFSVWVTAVTRQAFLAALPLTLALIQTGIVIFLLTILNTAPPLGRGEPFQQLLQWSAAATALLAALLLQRAADWREVIGRLVLLDMGLLLLALAVPNPDTIQAALWLLAGRFASLLLACTGLSLWQRQGATGGFAPDPDNGRRAPWSIALLIYGCLSLLGLPLTPGFSGHWLVLTQATSATPIPWLTAAIFLALALAALALLRRIWASLSLSDRSSMSDDEPRSVKWLVGAAMFVGLLMTFLPSLFGRYAIQIASSLQ